MARSLPPLATRLGPLRAEHGAAMAELEAAAARWLEAKAGDTNRTRLIKIEAEITQLDHDTRKIERKIHTAEKQGGTT